jgi:hypothetical protein
METLEIKITKKNIQKMDIQGIINGIKNKLGLSNDVNDYGKVADYLYGLKVIKEKVKDYFKVLKEPIKEKLFKIESNEKMLLDAIEKEDSYYRDYINSKITESIQNNMIVDKRYEGTYAYITMVKDVEIEINDIKKLITAILNNEFGELGWSIIDIKKNKLESLVKTMAELNQEIPGVTYKYKANMRLINKQK